MATTESTPLRFQDKVAIVTGGCKGIGKGCVDVLVENGGKVTILDIDDSAGKDIKTSGPGEVFYLHCDTTNEDQIKTAIEVTVSRFGRIDCLVNNAGWHPPNLTIEGFSGDDFRELLELNLVGYFLTCKYTLPHLRNTKGSIVNIASVSGVIGQGESVTYSATKGGVIAMSKALAVDEAKHDVRVNSLSPGGVCTPLMNEYRKSLTKEQDENFTDIGVMRRFADIREMGKACLFLAVDATFTTGENLCCTGGMEVGYGNKYA